MKFNVASTATALLSTLIMWGSLSTGECAQAIDIDLSSTKNLNIMLFSGNGAEVQRTFAIDRPQDGTYTLNVNGITGSIVDDSIQLVGEGNADILDVKINSKCDAPQNNPQYLALKKSYKEQLAEIDKKLQQLMADAQLLSTQETLLRSYYTTYLTSERTVKDTKVLVGPDEVASLLAKFEKDSQSITERQRKVGFEQQHAMEDRETISKKLNQLNADYNIVGYQEASVEYDSMSVRSQYNSASGGNFAGGVTTYNKIGGGDQSSYVTCTKILKQLVVQLRVKTPVGSKKEPTLKFQLTYSTRPALWSPQYEINLQTVDANKGGKDVKDSAVDKYLVTIEYYANVRQKTGEDWIDANLTLSTSNPASISSQPSPRRQYVSLDYIPPVDFMQAGGGVNRGAMHMMKMAKTQSAMAPGMAFDAGAESAQVDSSSIEFAAAVSSSQANVGSTHLFNIPYPVTVTDVINLVERNVQRDSYSHMILIDKIQLPSHVFTYAVPSQEARAFLLTHTDYPSTFVSPLLSSDVAKLQIMDSSVGKTMFPGVQPGERIKLNFGENRFIKIETNDVIPSQSGKEEDKSTWFVKDKRKFKIRTIERLTTVTNSHHTKRELVIITENLPKSMQDGELKVELLLPAKPTFTLSSYPNDENHSHSTASTRDECISNMLQLAAKSAGDKLSTVDDGKLVNCYSSLTGNLYWMLWLAPHETKSLPYKFKVTWPDERDIHFS